jgi:uncharacterized protein (DUF4415 family)
MKKSRPIVRITAAEARRRIARGEVPMDWARFDSMTEAELERNIASDPDADIDVDWSTVTVDAPLTKRDVHMKLDADVLAWFKAGGRGYQTRINAVLKAYVRDRRRRRAA